MRRTWSLGGLKANELKSREVSGIFLFDFELSQYARERNDAER